MAGKEDGHGPVQTIPFWATGGFLGLYGVDQVPQVHQLGAGWDTALAYAMHILALVLGIYFTAESGKRIRAWLGQHIQISAVIHFGDQNPSSRASDH